MIAFETALKVFTRKKINEKSSTTQHRSRFRKTDNHPLKTDIIAVFYKYFACIHYCIKSPFYGIPINFKRCCLVRLPISFSSIPLLSILTAVM